MANRLNWTLGHEGKGNVYKDGHISTWDVDEVQEPHHQEVADQEGEYQPVFLFYITPEGGVHDGGIGFNNLTVKPDQTIIAEICQADPNLWDASDEEVELDDSVTPRDPETFGHADKLMYSKLASMGAMHCELEIPRHVRREIRKWVDKLEWPEGSDIHDARKYHITILTFDKYDEDFIKFMSNEIKGRGFTFKSTRFDMFGDYLVLRLECPEWDSLAVRWGELADNRGLEPRRFPGGPKCHISVGEIPSGKWPRGVPNPNIEFTTKMFNVNINRKTADAWADRQPAPGQLSLEDELAQWLQSAGQTPSQAISPHHSDPTQVIPNQALPRARGPHIDPPSHPYEPYDWASEGDFVTPRMSRIKDINGVSAPYMEHYADASDEPGDTLMPPDWVHMQGRIQHFYDEALANYKDFQQDSGLAAGQPQEHALIMAQDRLIENLEALGLNDQDIYDVSKRFVNECMDSVPENPIYPNHYTQPTTEDMPTERPSEWTDVTPEQFTQNALNPDAPDPEGFYTPPGWMTTPQEQQALIYQAMRDAIEQIRQGRDVKSANLLFLAQLDRMGVAPDRKEQASAEFKQFAQEVVNQRAVQQEMAPTQTEAPDTLPPEWTAAMKRIAAIVMGKGPKFDFKTWRDPKTWPSNITPEQYSLIHAFKHHLPNTKYGNMLAPMLFQWAKNGHVRGNDMGHVDVQSAYRRLQDLRAQAQQATDPVVRRAYEDDIKAERANLDSELDYLRNYGGTYVNYDGGDDYDSETMLEDFHPEVIPMLKWRARMGKPVQNLNRYDPVGLKRLVDEYKAARAANYGRVIHRWPNGWSVRKLRNAEEAEYEGDQMDNCIGDYGSRVERGDTHIYSLRDPKNKPHASWALDDPTDPDKHYGGEISQLYGKGNEEPKDKYKAALRDFFGRIPEQHKPEGESSFEVATPEQLAETPIDEYGLRVPRYINYDSLAHSLTKTPDGAYAYQPERIDSTLSQLKKPEARGLLNAVDTMASPYVKVLPQLQEQDNAHRGLMQTPYLQTLTHIQTTLGDSAWDPYYHNNDLRPFTARTAQPHIGADGHPCTCAWGEHRPAWQEGNDLMTVMASTKTADMWHCDDPECQKEHAEGDGDAARCENCGQWALHIPCDHCGADPANQHELMKEEWGDRIYGQPGSPTEWPKQKTIWRDESTPDVKNASHWDFT